MVPIPAVLDFPRFVLRREQRQCDKLEALNTRQLSSALMLLSFLRPGEPWKVLGCLPRVLDPQKRLGRPQKRLGGLEWRLRGPTVQGSWGILQILKPVTDSG